MNLRIKRKVVRELKSIRDCLRFSLTSRQIDDLLRGAESVVLPDSKPIQQERRKPVFISDLDTLKQSLSTKIKAKADLYAAMAYWSIANLLDFTKEQRSAICSILVAKSLELGVQPKPAWVSVLKSPEFFEEWADEVYGSPSDSEASLDEVAL